LKSRVFVGALIAAAMGCSGEIRYAATTDGGADETAVTCAIDSDCVIDGLHCDVSSHQCVACISDSDCKDPQNTRCDAVSHQCVQCGLSSDCGDNETCIGATHECVQQCSLGNENCPSTRPSCDTARGICVACSSDAQCTTSDQTLCLLESGRCVTCLNDANCHSAERPRCDAAGECVRCVSGADCPASAPLCEPDKHVCVAR
jgi:hypothetical protein